MKDYNTCADYGMAGYKLTDIPLAGLFRGYLLRAVSFPA